MSFGGGLFFTNRGRALQAKAQAGAQLTFTRIAVGDGSLSGQAIADLTALIHEVKSITINKLKTLTGGKAVVGGVLSNQDLQTGFYWRELGLFAQDPDLGEILYCYGNAGDLAEYIPSPGGAEILEKQVDIVAIVGNASNVTATIEQSLVYVTQQDFNYKFNVGAGEGHKHDGTAGQGPKISYSDLSDKPTAMAPTAHKSTHASGGTDVLTPVDIGAETPAGAQAKVDTHAANTTAHGATSAATANTIIMRDASGRAKVAAPSASDDIARKDTVDTVQTNLNTHTANTTTAHGATSAATANTIIMRDASGRAKVAAPSAVDDIARKDTVDAHANLTTSAHGGIVASADVVTTATANKILKLDASAKLPASITGDAHSVDGVHVTGSNTTGLRKITTSTADPSGGSDGDVWIKYA